jgi:sugar phosphate isomerase/epimerase
MEKHGMNRRQALGIGAGALAGAALLPGAAAAQDGRRERLRAPENLVPRQNIGIQLYSLRDLQAADPAALIANLAARGYTEVELFTLGGRTVAQWNEILANNNVRAIAAHVGIDRFRADSGAVFEEAASLGMHYVGLPGIFDATRPNTAAGWRRLSRQMNEWGEEAADVGLKFYYHNHDFEFARVGSNNMRIFDIMLEETDPDLVFFELDLYWAVTAGVDPLDYLTTYDQSRFPLFHVKDRSATQVAGANFADLGEGNINFRRIFQSLENKHYHHYIVERDTQVNPLQTAETGSEYLRELRGRRRRAPYTPSEAGRDAGRNNT